MASKPEAILYVCCKSSFVQMFKCSYVHMYISEKRESLTTVPSFYSSGQSPCWASTCGGQSRRSRRWCRGKVSYKRSSFPVAIFSHVADHRLKRLCMAVVVVLVDELNGTEAAQVVECLLERQPETPPELSGEDECPFYLVCKIVCHNLYSCE